MKAPQSVRKRLIFVLGLVLLAVWLSAAIFTKKTAFSQSRAFLEEQAQTNALLLLEAVKDQPIAPSDLSLDQQRVVLLWRDQELKLGLVEDEVSKVLATYRGQELDVVELIGQDNWVIAARCFNDDCAVVAIRDTDRKIAIRRLVASIFLPMFGLFLAGLGAVYLAIRYALNPLDELVHSVQKMEPTSGLKLNHAPNAAELLPIVDAINDMSKRTREHLDREQAFLDACAHEIRTPLAGLIAQVQSLQDSAQSDLTKSMRAHLTFIERSAQRTSRIANQFLGLAKTRNRLADETRSIRFDLVEFLRSTAAEAMTRDTTLEVCLRGETSVWVESDPLPIELVFRNLLENAQQHARRSEVQVQVTVQLQNNEVCICVEDNGRGVPTDELKILDRRFFRVSADCIDQSSGTGLGLSIVRDIVSSFDGHLAFGSSAELGGLSVNIRLKLKHSDSASPRKELPQKTKEKL